jgi:hypothetical protein
MYSLHDVADIHRRIDEVLVIAVDFLVVLDVDVDGLIDVLKLG